MEGKLYQAEAFAWLTEGQLFQIRLLFPRHRGNAITGLRTTQEDLELHSDLRLLHLQRMVRT